MHDIDFELPPIFPETLSAAIFLSSCSGDCLVFVKPICISCLTVLISGRVCQLILHDEPFIECKSFSN